MPGYRHRLEGSLTPGPALNLTRYVGASQLVARR